MHTLNKIAAPKPIRARPIALSNLHGNSKWIETSPIKEKESDLFGLEKGDISEEKSIGGNMQTSEFLEMPNFKIE